MKSKKERQEERERDTYEGVLLGAQTIAILSGIMT
jgi:hypothetical protein